MSLNKIKGNMYGFITHTWNPLAGKCPHECLYCSTKALMRYPNTAKKYSGELRLEELYLKDDLGSDRFIFVCAQNDLFAEDVPNHIIEAILIKCEVHPKNKYLFQSKNPKRMIGFIDMLPKTNTILATTIETNRDRYRESKAPPKAARAYSMAVLSALDYQTMVTIEPIIDFDLGELVELIALVAQPEWINVGADSKGHGLPEPDGEKVRELIAELKHVTGVKLKSNLERITKER